MAVINQGSNRWRRLAGVGCLLLTPRLAGARPPRDDDRRRQRANRKNGNGGRALKKNKLMPQREVVRYSVDPRTVTPRAGKGAPPPEWDHDIDYHQKGLCGGAKCFFLSVSNPAEGYLLVHGSAPAPGTGLDQAVKAYEYALDLETRYGIRHFYAATPYQVPTPEYFRQNLVGDYVTFFGEAESMIVQPEHTAPSGSIIVRCFNDRMLFTRLEYILQSMTLPMKENLLKELQDTIALVQAEPGLITDFQLLIDLEGRVFHLDFERAFHRTTGPDAHSFKGCLEGAVEFLKMSAMSHATSFVLENGDVKLVRAPQDEGVGIEGVGSQLHGQ